jgi:hypothetical protein
VKEIPLTQGFVALVDDTDYAAAVRFRWCVQTRDGGIRRYARRRTRVWEPFTSNQITLHQWLTGWPNTDHINGDGLDNRRANLRLATCAQNSANRRRSKNNTSGFKGVSWRKDLKCWAAHIRDNGHANHLGMFEKPEEAARAYDAAALTVWGEFASLNFPTHQEHR